MIRMKKLLIVLMVLCLVVTAGIGLDFAAGGKLPAPAATAEAAPSSAPAATPAPATGLDYDALYALHEPDEVVMTVGGKAVPWSEYFYYLSRQSQSVESYFNMMAAYGMAADWDDPVDGGEETYQQLTLESAEATAQSLTAMGSYAEKQGVTLSEEDRAAIETKAESDYAAIGGEGATREDFEAYLESIYLPAELYDRMNELSVLYQNGFAQLYGENGEKLSDEEAMAYLEDNAYMAANHILLMTIDPATYESLDEETVAAKKAQAEEIAAELRAITDTEELLTRFAELKEELDEDTGKVVYSDGYVFLPGEMVTEFEETAKSQEAYQVSEPVESTYGYHIILTLPLDPDAVLSYSSAGAPMTARSTAANEAYSQALDAYTLEQEIVYADGFEPPVLKDYLK